MSEASVAWARESIDQLSRTLVELSLSPEPIDVGARGAAIAVRTDADYFVTLFAPVSEGSSTVVLVDRSLQGRTASPTHCSDAG